MKAFIEFIFAWVAVCLGMYLVSATAYSFADLSLWAYNIFEWDKPFRAAYAVICAIFLFVGACDD